MATVQRLQKLTFRALALSQSLLKNGIGFSWIRSDEGLTLETSAFLISVRWPIYIVNSVDKTKFLYINWYNSSHSKKISALSKKEIVYGVLNGWSSSSILNHLILIGKYFLYRNALEENIKFQFADYVNFVYEKLRVEKCISVMTNTQTAFVEKWHRFLE